MVNILVSGEAYDKVFNHLHAPLEGKYPLRSSWIPAFFVDSPLCRLMRTTSMSESENSFFSYFTSSGSTLVKFMLCYESAMESKRYTQEKLDHQSFDSFSTLLTPLPFEDHAAKVYTRSLFIRVKIKPVGLPEVIDKESTSENVKEEINLYQKVTGHYKVLYNKGDGSVSCSCQLFVRSRILCQKIFCVFKKFKVSCIPDRYILRHWTKDLIPPDLRNKKNCYGEKNEAIKKLAMEASIILFDFVQEFMGVKKPDKVKLKNPIGVRPKGREKQKCIKSGREISMKKSNKKRMVMGQGKVGRGEGELVGVLGRWFGLVNHGRGRFEVLAGTGWVAGLNGSFGEEAEMVPHPWLSCHFF
ncbi:FAR1 DNA binding domain, zinc finger, SWIM-type, MULE transposase domain containing protein [Tanacetum coccineum]